MKTVLNLFFARARKALAGGVAAAASAAATDLASGRPVNWGLTLAAFVAGWGVVFAAPANKPKPE